MPTVSYFPPVEHTGLILRKIKHCKRMPSIFQWHPLQEEGTLPQVSV